MKRMELVRRTRRFFEERAYWEVDTKCLVPVPGEEVHLHPLHCHTLDAYGQTSSLFLHTSPEFAMKKIMAAFHHPIFQLAHVWRNKEGSQTHSVEFSMLEWYRPYASLENLMDETEEYVKAMLPPQISYSSYNVDLQKPFRRITMQEAFVTFAGIDLLSCGEDAQALAQAAHTVLRDHETWEDLFFRLMLERVEPALAQLGPCFLTHWPAAQAALARRSSQDSRVALRFELYIAGIELANAFEELTDAVEQRERFLQDRKTRQLLYGNEEDYKSWPLDTELLESLPTMPPCSGIALGFDRLVMLACKASSITKVQW
ncbi:EF-P lysine aminoacylase EpmA [Entomobacter blattae]|nr:EF-P lysine aminoacylase EpmA [Entomobacter blattae]